MNKNLVICFLCCILAIFCRAQEKDSNNKELDSIQKNIQEKGMVVEDSLFKKRKAINPLAPSKAAFYSAIVPGLGQVYNKRYWKVPLVYAAIGTAVYAYTWNNDNYGRFRTAFKRRKAGFMDDEFYDINKDNLPGDPPDLDIEDLENQQERFQRDRDLYLVVSIALYALNIIDANVDAHLKQFNVDKDLSLDIKPYLDLNPITNNPNYGMALTIKF